MIVYRDHTETVSGPPQLLAVQAALRSLAAAGIPDHDSIVSGLIEFGEFEAAYADHLCAGEDIHNEDLSALRLISTIFGRLLNASWRGHGADAKRWASELGLRAGAFCNLQVPPVLHLRVPEGFAYYGLAPEMYLEAAARFHGQFRPSHAVCIGIRGIGASLSGIVAGALEDRGCRAASITVRPRGHPFDRRVALSRGLAEMLSSVRDTMFLVIDEGPGLSGSSMASVAEALSGLEIGDERIVFFPSWLPDGETFKSDSARRRWPRHRKCVVGFEEVWLARGRLFGGDVNYSEISAGGWRPLVYGNESQYPAVHPQHERRKFLVEHGTAHRLFKFAGYGTHGRRKLRRAQQLFEAGFAPAPVGMRSGFMVTEFVAGVPCESSRAEPPLLESMAKYLAFIGRTPGTPAPVPEEPLLEMLLLNTSELLGEPMSWLTPRIEPYRDEIGRGTPVPLDGRMMPHEWLRVAGRYLKTDALDHGSDHFFPGRQDIAWDLACASVEFALDAAAEKRFLELYVRAGGEHISARRLNFFKAAYLAFRLGYASMAAGSLAGTADGGRFERLTHRYRSALRHAIENL